MGILIGVDFYPGIKGIGQHTALDLIRKYGSLEKIIMNNIIINSLAGLGKSWQKNETPTDYVGE